MFPSSQLSSPTTRPSPHIAVQLDGVPVQFQPVSTPQVLLHPSSGRVFPSSQLSSQRRIDDIVSNNKNLLLDYKQLSPVKKEKPEQQLKFFIEGYVAPFLSENFKHYIPTYVMRNSYRVLKKKNVYTSDKLPEYSFVTPYTSTGRVPKSRKSKEEEEVYTDGKTIDAKRNYVNAGSYGRVDKYTYNEHWVTKNWNWAVKQMKVHVNNELNDLNKDYNVEFLMMRKLNEEFVFENVTPHITLLLGMNRFVQDSKYYVNVAMEYCNYGDFRSFLNYQISSDRTEKEQDNAIKNIKILFMQLFFTFAVILDKYPDYRHEDLRADNILVQSRKTDCDHYYFIDGQIYKVPKEFPYSIRISDFGLNHMSSGGIGGKLNNPPYILSKYEYSDIWSLMFNTNGILWESPGVIKEFVERCFTFDDRLLQDEITSENFWHGRLYDIKGVIKQMIKINGVATGFLNEPYNKNFLRKTWKHFLTTDDFFKDLRVKKDTFDNITSGTKIHAYGKITELSKYPKLKNLTILNYSPKDEYIDSKLQTAS